jgi:hypothetical protein
MRSFSEAATQRASRHSSAIAWSPDITATPDMDAPPTIVEDRTSGSSARFSTASLRHEDLAFALETESGATPGRRASLIPSQSLAPPLFATNKVFFHHHLRL